MTIKLNMDNWTFKDLIDFTRAGRDNDDEKAVKLLVKIVVEWDYDVSITFEELDNLFPLEAAKILYEAGEAMGDVIMGLDVSIVNVDFRKADWRNKRFREFMEARNEQNSVVIERMLREVCTMPGFTPEDKRPLSFYEGSRMVRAVMDSYQNVLSGKA